MQNSLAVAILKTLFTVLRKVFSFLFSPQGRIVLVAGIIFVVFLVVRGQFAGDNTADSAGNIPAYQGIMPSKQIAPRILQTSTRYFVYSTFQENSEYFILTDYFDYNSKTWQHHTSPLPVLKSDIVKNITR